MFEDNTLIKQAVEGPGEGRRAFAKSCSKPLTWGFVGGHGSRGDLRVSTPSIA